MLAVVMVLALVMMLAGAAMGGWWLRRSGLTPAWITDDNPVHFPAQLLVFCAFVFVPYIACPVLLVYVLRQRRRKDSQSAHSATG